jgi:hypothetical protein
LFLLNCQKLPHAWLGCKVHTEACEAGLLALPLAGRGLRCEEPNLLFGS